jgi:hypothetical protein
MRRFACLGLVTALAAAGTGCDYGTAPEDGASMRSALLDPSQTLSPDGPTLGVSPGWATPTADPAEDTTADSRAAEIAAQTGSADCVDFGSGVARLVPCTLRRPLSNPVGHDDPDPWHPAATAATPH